MGSLRAASCYCDKKDYHNNRVRQALAGSCASTKKNDPSLANQEGSSGRASSDRVRPQLDRYRTIGWHTAVGLQQLWHHHRELAVQARDSGSLGRESGNLAGGGDPHAGIDIPSGKNDGRPSVP